MDRWMNKPGQDSPPAPPDPDPEYRVPHSGRVEDRVYLSSRREALVVLVVFVLSMIWTVGYCYLYGYGGDIRQLKFVLGFPSWVFWGVVMPWGVCIAFSLFFGAYFVR